MQPVKDPKRTGLKAVPVVFELDDGCLPDYGEPGNFELRLSQGSVLLACPGCGRVSGMSIGNPKPSRSPSWLITGEPSAPTFAPSINCEGCCGWHGHLKAGIYEICK